MKIYKPVLACTLILALLSGCSGIGSSSQGADVSNSQSGVEAQSGQSEAITMETVTLPAGDLVGIREDGVYSFKGIPYATAERFQAPVPVTAYEGGMHMALAYGPVAPQDRTLSATGSVNVVEIMTPSNGTADMVGNETCQYLNVWSSDLTAKKPVVVFFHGGGLSSGASSELSTYTGQYFAQTEDAVFVSVNHRLNVLGYLDLSEYGEEYALSANAGLQDCVCALEWVRDHIAQFGGDPDNVTIVGQSGGGHKVTALACMPETVGLFDKVVSISGYYDFQSQEESRANTQLLVDYLGLDRDEVIPTLTAMSYEDLYDAYSQAGCSFTYATYGNRMLESPLFDQDGNLNPYAARRTWIIGTTYGEGGASNGIYLTIANDQSRYLPGIDDAEAMQRLQEMYGADAERIAELYQQAYPGHALAEALFVNNNDVMISREELIRKDDGILTRMNEAGLEVYNYVVAYTMPYFGGITMAHTCDMPFWFNSLDTVRYMVKGDEENAYQVAQTMADALAAFAATGNPSTSTLEWMAYSSGEHNTMVFDTESMCKTAYDEELFDLMLQAQ